MKLSKEPNEQISHQFLLKNELQEACSYFEKKFTKAKTLEEKITLGKWYVIHLIHLSKYSTAEDVCNKLKGFLKKSRGEKFSDKLKGDIIYSLALVDYYLGAFQKTINRIFPIWPKQEDQIVYSEKSLIDLHNGEKYQQGLNFMLAGRCYWKKGHYSRACLHFYLAIINFHAFDPNCIWIPKTCGLIGLVYGFLEKFDYAYEAISIGRSRLEKNLGPDYKEHHIYGCLDSDEGDIKLRQWKYDHDNGKRRNLSIKEMEQLFQEIETHFEKSESIFANIYKSNKNRYSATVTKNFLALYSWKCSLETRQKQIFNDHKKAKGYFDQDILIRTTHLFIDKKRTDNSQSHHPTIARTYNLYAELEFKLEKKLSGNHSENSLKIIRNAQRAMYSVVEGYRPTNIFEKNGDFELKNPKIDGADALAKISSFNTLLDSFRIKIQALFKLITGKHTQEQKAHLKETVDSAVTFIGYIRPRLKSTVANLALSSKLRLLYEVILEYLYYKLETGSKDILSVKERENFKELVFKTIEESKNYNLVQSNKEQRFAPFNDELLLENLFEEFFVPLEPTVSFEFLPKLYSNINTICRDFRHQEKEDINRNISKNNEQEDPNYAFYQQKNTIESTNYITANEQIKRVAKDYDGGLDSVIISFFFGTQFVYFIKLDGYTFRFVRLKEKPSEIKRLIHQLLEYINDGSFDEKDTVHVSIMGRINTLSLKLYKIIFGQISFKDEERFLLVIPDGELNKLPFDILIPDHEYYDQKAIANNEEDSYDHYHPSLLIHIFYTSYHFSISLLNKSINDYWESKIEQNNKIELENRGSNSTLDHLGIGSTFNLKTGKFDEMYMTEEVMTVSRLFFNENNSPSDNLSVFVSDHDIFNPSWCSEIDNEKIMKKPRSYKSIKVLHISAHGNDKTNMIHLGPKTNIDVNEFIKSSLPDGPNTILVILSGCESGSGEITRGEMLNTLARYFLGSEKVSNVIHMLTQVPDMEHAEFDNVIIKFFEILLDMKNLGKNPTFAIALAKAKQEKMKEINADYSYYARLTAIAGPTLVGCPLDRL